MTRYQNIRKSSLKFCQAIRYHATDYYSCAFLENLKIQKKLYRIVKRFFFFNGTPHLEIRFGGGVLFCFITPLPSKDDFFFFTSIQHNLFHLKKI